MHTEEDYRRWNEEAAEADGDEKYEYIYKLFAMFLDNAVESEMKKRRNSLFNFPIN